MPSLSIFTQWPDCDAVGRTVRLSTTNHRTATAHAFCAPLRSVVGVHAALVINDTLIQTTIVSQSAHTSHFWLNILSGRASCVARPHRWPATLRCGTLSHWQIWNASETVCTCVPPSVLFTRQSGWNRMVPALCRVSWSSMVGSSWIGFPHRCHRSVAQCTCPGHCDAHAGEAVEPMRLVDRGVGQGRMHPAAVGAKTPARLRYWRVGVVRFFVPMGTDVPSSVVPR